MNLLICIKMLFVPFGHIQSVFVPSSTKIHKLCQQKVKSLICQSEQTVTLSFLFFPKDGLLFCKVCIATKQHTKKHFHFISVNNIVAKKLLPGKHINLKVLNNYRRKTQAWSMKNVVLITLISLETCCGYKNQIVIFISWLLNPEFLIMRVLKLQYLKYV